MIHIVTMMQLFSGQSSPVLEGIAEEGSDAVPELLVVPPPPPRKALPDTESLGPAPEKPERPPSVNLSEFIHPPPLQFSKSGTMDGPEFEDVGSEAHSPELQVSDWGSGEHIGPDTPDGQNVPEFYSNGMITPAAEVNAAPVLTDQNTPLLDSSVSQDSSQQAG